MRVHHDDVVVSVTEANSSSRRRVYSWVWYRSGQVQQCYARLATVVPLLKWDLTSLCDKQLRRPTRVRHTERFKEEEDMETCRGAEAILQRYEECMV